MFYAVKHEQAWQIFCLMRSIEQSGVGRGLRVVKYLARRLVLSFDVWSFALRSY